MEFTRSLEWFFSEHRALILLLAVIFVYFGMGKLAFTTRSGRLLGGQALVIGLAALLTIALFDWSASRGYGAADLGFLAAVVLIEAILILGLGAFRRSGS